jgi:hypothetical protein
MSTAGFPQVQSGIERGRHVIALRSLVQSMISVTQTVVTFLLTWKFGAQRRTSPHG